MKIIDKIKENYSFEVVFLALASFLAGVIIGILVSPVKNGIAIGSQNGSYNKFEDSNNVNKPNKKGVCKCDE